MRILYYILNIYTLFLTKKVKLHLPPIQIYQYMHVLAHVFFCSHIFFKHCAPTLWKQETVFQWFTRKKKFTRQIWLCWSFFLLFFSISLAFFRDKTRCMLQYILTYVHKDFDLIFPGQLRERERTSRRETITTFKAPVWRQRMRYVNHQQLTTSIKETWKAIWIFCWSSVFRFWNFYWFLWQL